MEWMSLARARAVLAERFGYPCFRTHQLKVLGPLLAGRDVLAVLPTGAGKSLCFQVPALLGQGLTLVISPLISLMQDQVGALRRRGINAAYVNSQLDAEQRRTVLAAATSGRLTLLYCAPERLASLTRRLVEARTPVALLAIDEAHCITEWGNEFRPVYRRLGVFRSLLGRPPTIALTGSATPAARADILKVLRIPDAHIVVTSFDRPNLHFAVRRVRDDRERFAMMREQVRNGSGASIIYTPTRARGRHEQRGGAHAPVLRTRASGFAHAQARGGAHTCFTDRRRRSALHHGVGQRIPARVPEAWRISPPARRATDHRVDGKRHAHGARRHSQGAAHPGRARRRHVVRSPESAFHRESGAG